MPTRSSPKRCRVAALDVGSNAVRLMVAEITPGGAFKVLRDERVATQLGKGLADTGQLNAAGIAASVDAIGRFHKLAVQSRAEAFRAVATAAVRDASNGLSFLERVRRETKVSVEVISGDEEGALAFLSLARRFDVAEVPAASIDIGGGSAQVILSTHGVPAKVVSMPLGAVRLTDQFGGWQAMATKSFPKLCRFIDDAIEETLDSTPLKPRILIGTGGAVTTVALLAQAHRADSGKVSAKSAKRKTDTSVDHRTLKAMIQAFRDSAPNLPAFAEGASPDRLPILFAGLVVLERLADTFGIKVVHSHAGGLREGLCWALADRVFTPAASPVDAARALAVRCRYDRDHSEHVAALSRTLLSALSDVPAVRKAVRHEPKAGDLLQAAALLHDIGTVVGYAKHHKHSRDIILCSDVPHHTRREVLILANLARYHRRVGPTKSHRLFAGLPVGDQQLVRVLSGVLRVADGLDRSHEALVDHLSLDFGRKFLVITPRPESGEDLRREIRAARSKSDVLAAALGLKLKIAAEKPVKAVKASKSTKKSAKPGR